MKTNFFKDVALHDLEYMYTNDVLKYTNDLQRERKGEKSNILQRVVCLRNCVIIPRHRELLPEDPEEDVSFCKQDF